MIKKIIVGILIICVLSFVCSTYNVEKATTYVTEHAEKKSRCCCAWYVMRAMQAGGNYIGIYPAWMYR